MARNRPKSENLRVWQSRAGWLLTLLVCLLLALSWRERSRPDADAPEPNDRLSIERILPLEISPGGALAITFSGNDPSAGPLHVTLDKQDSEILQQSPSTLVVRVPRDLHEGRVSVRLTQGDARSKKRDVWLRALDLSQVVEMGIAGIALFVLGLRTLSRGIRTYTGNRLRELLGKLTRGRWRSFGVGLLAGAATQSTVTTTGVLVGLLMSSLLPVTVALAIILGAQLGSAVIAIVVPFGGRVSVLLVALGVVWVSLAADRHRRALAKVLLGLGLLFFGFETLRTGFQPLVSNPEVVRVFSHAGGDVLHTALSVLAGTFLTAILQGPGPAFALVLGLAESTEIVGVHQGLTVLSGAPLGVALATSIVAWPFGGTSRRWAIGHLIVGGVCTLFLASSVGLWANLADWIVPSAPSHIELGDQGLVPSVATHLTLAFLLSHAVALSAMVLALPRFSRWLEAQRPTQKSSSGTGETATQDATASAGIAGQESFVIALTNLKDALGSIRGLWATGDRAGASDSEQSLDSVQRTVTRELAQAQKQVQATDSSFGIGLALLNVRDSLAWMQRMVERGIEWGVSAQDREMAALERLHLLASQGLDAVLNGVQQPASIDGDSAREREIWMNAEDSRARAQLERLRKDLPLSYTRHWSAVCAAYEELGNQLFHAHETLLGEADDD